MKKLNLCQTRLFFYYGIVDCPLSYKDRLVWSAIVYRYKPVTRYWLRKTLALHPHTINRSIGTLLSVNLIQEKPDKTLTALEPTGEASKWFGHRESNKTKWKDQLGYFPLIVPALAEQALHCCLTFQCRKVNKQNTSKGRLCRRLGFSHPTITAALGKLTAQNFIMVQRADRGLTVELVEPFNLTPLPIALVSTEPEPVKATPVLVSQVAAALTWQEKQAIEDERIRTKVEREVKEIKRAACHRLCNCNPQYVANWTNQGEWDADSRLLNRIAGLFDYGDCNTPVLRYDCLSCGVKGEKKVISLALPIDGTRAYNYYVFEATNEQPK